jgi:hypothetical protein
MAELLAAYESAVISTTPDAAVASAVYVPSAERRRLLLIGQLKQLIADNGSTEQILEKVVAVVKKIHFP